MKNQMLTKAQLREVRELAGLAHERELTQAAEALHQQFESWRRGEMDVFALNEKIHKFHDGVSRELFKKYSYGDGTITLAAAVLHGVIAEKEVPSPILEQLRATIEALK